jgi:hypothetical protein
LSSGLAIYTYIHVAISLLAIASGFVVLYGMLISRPLDRVTTFFLATTVLTSVTGFGFPIDHGLTPGLAIGSLSLVVQAIAIYARYARHLAGPWRRVYVVTALLALYFNVLVLIVQSFQKVPILQSLAPKGSEPPFVAAQLTALAAFLILGTLALLRFRDRSASGP